MRRRGYTFTVHIYRTSLFSSALCNTTTIVSVFLYGCETWSVALRGGHCFEKECEPNSDEVTGSRRKLRNDIHNPYLSPGIVRMM
jgi:hypothetical protein